MKVILMQKVERLGEPGQQVDVAEGYARNFLLPRKLAVEASAGHLKSLAQLTAQAKNREDRAKQEAGAIAGQLRGIELTLKRRASEEAVGAPSQAPAAVPAEAVPEAPAGAEAPAPAVAEKVARLFGSVTSQDLSEALAARGISVDKKKILLEEPIKTLGRHQIGVRLHAEVTAEFTVVVEREG
ncbi:MAG: 50S ribosomal protein L9 [candidate division NC10 bacterium]|nr:50S ribosomal protein L9 [candidate division NC10 bacterium]